MRVLVLTTREPNQAALVRKLASRCEVAGVVLSANSPRRPPRHRGRLLANRIAARTVGRPFTAAWFELLARYDREHGGFPDSPRIQVDNVNDQGTLDAIADLSPDLIAVSGTNLVGERVIDAAGRTRGIVNLHTGISPHVKGGPNCTNWCLAEGWFHLIGNSVMWLDRGIDSGNLIASERTPLTGEEGLGELHWRVMEHAHDLCARAVAAIAAGEPVPDVAQAEVGSGPTFHNADWTASAMLRARRNFARRYRSGVAAAVRCDVPLVRLPER
jgi:methionyl-tRNA formyltransferase